MALWQKACTARILDFYLEKVMKERSGKALVGDESEEIGRSGSFDTAVLHQLTHQFFSGWARGTYL